MVDFDKENEKLNMLKEMERNCWGTETNEESSYEEVDEDYKKMIEEFEATERDMHSDERDYDAENYDD